MSNTVEIYDISESISVSDIAVYSLDINDITSGGTISITSAVDLSESGGTITASPIEIAEVKTSPETTVQVEVKVDSANTINITLDGVHEVSIADSVSLGPQGATGATGPSGVGSFPELTDNPFTVVGNNVGLHITDPQYELHISETLFAPLVTSSRMEIQGINDGENLFIVRAYDSEETKFVINLQGVTILGQFTSPPEAVDGGMFYSSSGEFYLGS